VNRKPETGNRKPETGNRKPETSPTMTTLWEKYDVPAPRYTSYPTVPYWETAGLPQDAWLDSVSAACARDPRLCLYLHLPFCESLCTFCGCNKHITRNHAVEEPYIETVLAEWRLYRERFPRRPVLRELHLGGGTPTFFRPANLARLVETILADVDVAPDAEFGFEAHPSGTTREHLAALYDLGFRRISIGVQDFDEEMLRLIHRFQTREQVRDVTAAAREIGYTSVNFDLVFGLPRQTREHIFRTAAEVGELRPDRIAFYSYAHVPWLRNGQRAYDERDLPGAAEKRALYDLGRELLEARGYRDVGLDHFALPHDGLFRAAENGALHRNFMGYTAVYTPMSLGLGASAIGDLGDAFAQNEKTVAGYEADVRSGRLPLRHGHYLTAEDRILRGHILDLMCRHRADWSAPERQTPALADAVERLRELEADGLATVLPQGVEVTPAGRGFLRNICLAFDARYWAKQPEGRVFSRAV
jgi:oxygen-independent coproporphyrinogen-3 oxidase